MRKRDWRKRAMPWALVVLILAAAIVLYLWWRPAPLPAPGVPTPTHSPTPTPTATRSPQPTPTFTPESLALESLLPRPRSLVDSLHLLRTEVGSRLRARFAHATVDYPPTRVALLGFKEERKLELWAVAANGGDHRHVHTYDILGASGTAGPKLQEGDWQVPEGMYALAGLNPNSSFHLSLKVNYPNAFDQRMAQRDRRTRLGGDIFIHGGDASIGCLAMGDWAVEELFLLAAEIGQRRFDVILAPWDMRKSGDDQAVVWDGSGPRWIGELYGEIARALAGFERRH